MSQVNLHCHSEHSFLDGLANVKEIAKRVKENGSQACAITDHNEVSGHLAFQNACLAEDLHPILGIEADWVYSMEETRQLSYPTNRSHICLLAENNKGLSNIWTLASLAYEDKYRYYKPLITPDLMREYRDGVYFSDGCMITEFGRAIERGDEDGARQHFGTLLDIAGDHFYSELHTWQFCDPDTDAKKRLNNLMRDINQAKVRFATEMGVPLVVVNDSHHAYPEQWENKELVWKFSTSKRKKGDDQDTAEDDYGQKADHLMDGDELYYWMSRHGIGSSIIDQAIRNSAVIAKSCHAEISRTLDMPRLNRTEQDDLIALIDVVDRGFKAKVIDQGLPQDIYYKRAEEELRLIAEKQFSGYFLLVKDYVGAAITGEWSPYVNAGSPKMPMLVGPGRGSAGGCLVAYLLGITSLDPIYYDLLFERFLSPGRKDYPDVDVDFPRDMRPNVKHYLESRHGHDHVCTIGTLTRSQPKAILKDLGRAMRIPLSDVVAMSKIVEQVKTIETEDGDESATWEEVVERKGGELSSWASRYPVLFSKINEMTGLVRQSGVHPSGVVVSNKPLLGTIPLRTKEVGGKNRQLVTQLDMYEVEVLGAVKLDLLGLRHLDTLMYARNLIYERHGVWLDYRGDGIKPSPEATVKSFGYELYTDKDIWVQIGAGHTVGVFQLETAALTRASTELKPMNERDVAALISIVRPGVTDAGLDTAYLHRRAGVIPVEYDHPMMESITKETYGVLIYQEQLLRAARELAGFTPDEADDLRKALGKKLMDKVKTFKDKFVQGCLDNYGFMEYYIEYTPDADQNGTKAAERIWASIEASGRYAFNLSHAVGYATISTWEIWTKHYYPVECMVALMVTDGDNIDRYVREARRLKIDVLPPDVNGSAQKFTVEGGSIRYGIDSMRGVGAAMAKDIQAGRPYISFEDYLERAGRGTNKTAVFNLIRIGAFDSIGDRADLLRQYERYRITCDLAESTRANPEKMNKIIDRRLADPANRIEIPDFSNPKVVYEIERELVGNYITVDPMEPYLEAIDAVSIEDPAEIDSFEHKAQFVVGGQLVAVKTINIKKAGRNHGREMAFLTIQHNEMNFEVTVFPETWSACKLLLVEGVPVACQVVRDDRGCHLKHLERLDLLMDNSRA